MACRRGTRCRKERCKIVACVKGHADAKTSSASSPALATAAGAAENLPLPKALFTDYRFEALGKIRKITLPKGFRLRRSRTLSQRKASALWGTTSTLITRGAIFKLVNYASEMIRTGSNLGVKA